MGRGLRGQGLFATGSLVALLLGEHLRREMLAAMELSEQSVQIARRTGGPEIR